LIIVWNFEKASLSVRILKRDVSFKISDVKSVEKLQFESVLTRIFEKRGVGELMTCHLLLDNFFEISWPLCCFQRLRVLKPIFVSRKLWYLEFDIMKCSSFLNLVFRRRLFIAENWLCFRACNSRIVTYEQEFCVSWCDFAF